MDLFFESLNPLNLATKSIKSKSFVRIIRKDRLNQKVWICLDLLRIIQNRLDLLESILYRLRIQKGG